VNKNRVINGIEGSREIKETKSSDFMLSYGLDDADMNRKKSGFIGINTAWHEIINLTLHILDYEH